MNPNQSTANKAAIMAETAKQLIEMIRARQNSRTSALLALTSSPLDNIPDSVKEMREEEASKLRAVIQEQMDIIAIIQMLYPDVKTDEKPGDKTRKGKTA